MAFSNALKKNFSEYGLVSRYGGDEFVVLANMDSKDQITDILKQATDDVHAIKLSDDNGEETDTKDFLISFSAGVASYPQDATSLAGLQKCADTALYTVKERGRNAYLWYNTSFEN